MALNEKFENAIRSLSELTSEISKRKIEIKKMFMEIEGDKKIESPITILKSLRYSALQNFCLLLYLNERLNKEKVNEKAREFLELLLDLFEELNFLMSEIHHALELSKDYVELIEWLEKEGTYKDGEKMMCPKCGVEMIDMGDSHVRPKEHRYYFCLKCKHSYRYEKKEKKLVDLGREAI